jgi:uncharacterized damage-inducible protein DinB
MPLSHTLLPEFDLEMGKTRATLERLPEDKLSWKPHERSMTLGRLASHLAEIPWWAAVTMQQDSLDIAPAGEPAHQAANLQSRAEILELFDRNRTAAREALARAADDRFMQRWSLLRGGNPLFTMPRVAVIRGMVMNHLIHHRGQLTVYYRMSGVPVPALYGPSADEDGMQPPETRSAAS